MKTRYQLIIIGFKRKLVTSVVANFYDRVKELGIDENSIITITQSNFSEEYKPNAPAYCLYFGSLRAISNVDKSILKTLISDATLILPIVNDITKFSKQIPTELSTINGFELKDNIGVDKLVSVILEGLSLLRQTRRLFISYKRSESTGVAIQLYEYLEKSGFDVFLDTHSVRPGEVFQEELWHRMTDTDVVVLLNTPDFLKSYWTTQELAKANAMSIGILQLVWPNQDLEVGTTLSIANHLSSKDFKNNKFKSLNSVLIKKTSDNIVAQVESLRARSLAARQDNLVTEFMISATNYGVEANLHPEKYIIVKNSAKNDILVIPAVGVPKAEVYDESDKLLKLLKGKNISSAYILYDHRNVREKWTYHLDWLNSYLPITAIKITEIETWLKNI